MIRAGTFCGRPCFRWLAVLLLAFSLATPASAAELKLEARLIWGTNDDNYSDPKYKKVDETTAERFRKIFKWKHYFEINRQTGMVPSRGTKSFKMSEKCAVEITELEGPKVEVVLIGEGKKVNKTTKHLTKGEWFTIAGDDKNGCAWFVLITDLDEK
jgi:hypothetical protein